MESSLAFAPDFSKSGASSPPSLRMRKPLMYSCWQTPKHGKDPRNGRSHCSRNRKCLWHKGGTSGHVQKVKSIRLDCDGDAVVLLIEQIGGAACHEGYKLLLA